MIEFVPVAKFREIDSKNSCNSIVEKGTCRTVMWSNKEYMISGAMGDGKGTDWECIWGYQVTDISAYQGKLTPLSYGDHFREVTEGKRERCYTGMLVSSDKRQLVVVGPQVTFKKVETGKQLSIF